MHFTKLKKETSTVGAQMKGQPGPVHGGRYDREFQGRFVAAVRKCASQAKMKATAESTTEKVAEGPTSPAEAAEAEPVEEIPETPSEEIPETGEGSSASPA